MSLPCIFTQLCLLPILGCFFELAVFPKINSPQFDIEQLLDKEDLNGIAEKLIAENPSP